jgi:hypothetical protein
MDSKQNIIFFIGLTLIIMVFWVNGYWSILKDGIFTNNGVPSGALKTPGTTPIKPTGGKCPAGYFLQNGQCVPEKL